MLSLLLASDLPPRSIMVTSELSAEIVRQIDKASDTCSLGVDVTDSSVCSNEVWKVCHVARKFSEEQGELEADKHFEASMYICDLAVLADVGELSSVLYDRYEENFLRKGVYISLGDGEYMATADFILFHDLINLELRVLYETSYSSFLFLPLYDTYRNNYPLYSNFSTETKIVLRNLTNSIADLIEGFGISGSYDATGIVPKVGHNPWQSNSVEIVKLQDVVKQICEGSRIEIREGHPDAQNNFDNCLRASEICNHTKPDSKFKCSSEAGTVEFENNWQNLPDICSAANETDDTGNDECREVALSMCDYELVSPEDKWIGQLISIRDFACGLAGKFLPV